MGGYERTVFVLITAHELCQKLEMPDIFFFIRHSEFMDGRFDSDYFR